MSEIENPISIAEVRRGIMEQGEQRRAALSGEPDLEGKNITSISAEAETAVAPIRDAWCDHVGQKHSHLFDQMSPEDAYNSDPSLRADVDAAREAYQVLKEGSRRAWAQRENAEFKRLRPQALAGDETDAKFSKDALDYLREVKGYTPQQAYEAYNFGGLGRAKEQAKLFDASNAWARDKRELQALDAKRNLNESMTLREASRRLQLKKRLGKA